MCLWYVCHTMAQGMDGLWGYRYHNTACITTTSVYKWAKGRAMDAWETVRALAVELLEDHASGEDWLDAYDEDDRPDLQRAMVELIEELQAG